MELTIRLITDSITGDAVRAEAVLAQQGVRALIATVGRKCLKEEQECQLMARAARAAADWLAAGDA